MRFITNMVQTDIVFLILIYALLKDELKTFVFKAPSCILFVFHKSYE